MMITKEIAAEIVRSSALIAVAALQTQSMTSRFATGKAPDDIAGDLFKAVLEAGFATVRKENDQKENRP